MIRKGKERDPGETVRIVKDAFESIGIETKTKEYKAGNELFSVLLYDPVCRWQVWGKGASKEFAMASAYGEAAERLQNRALYRTSLGSENIKRWPDEKRFPASKIWENEDIARDFRNSSSDPDDHSKEEFVKEYTGQEEVSFVPYYSVKTRQQVYMPEDLLNILSGSNGMASGNTQEEAATQALCEVIERYAKFEIILKELTPPRITIDEIRERVPRLADLITDIEKQSGCSLIVRDASLGKKLPVINVVLVDRQSGKYSSRFGSHPLFEIALERCLTEMAQGWKDLKTRQYMVSWPQECGNVLGFRNLSDSFRNDCADLPDAFFAGKPSWEYKSWEEKDTGNSEWTQHLTDILLGLSGDVYIRKYKYAGIYSVRIYAPGVSILPFKFGKRNLQYSKIRDIVHSAAALSEVTEAERAKEILFAITDDSSAVCARSDMRDMPLPCSILKALLAIMTGDKNNAASFLEGEQGRHEQCLLQYLRLEMSAKDKETIKSLIEFFFDEKIYEQVFRVMDGPSNEALKNWFDHSALTSSMLFAKKEAENEELQKVRRRQELMLIESMTENMLVQNGIRGD
ncbi:YcaO-like family protein [Butyrivibrio sp. AE2015]|uniref:YcaO-like family protein n=1 Tax=Butyrivibrio sp. AE2015 TaxID=1280663 RepID=UPI0003B71BFB|nr:YcaO-like family protein [Butyrivibrio sp. AE2015]